VIGDGRRRPVAVSAVIGALVLGVLLAPVLFAAAAVVDLCTPRARWRHVRLLATVLLALGIEVTGLAGLAVLWLASGGGRLTAFSRLHFALQHWWTSALLTAAHRTLGLRILVEDPEPARAGNVIVLGRHTSIGDAAIPAVLLGDRHRLDVRYVFKHDLRWDPCIDTIARRVGHVFVDRRDDSGRAATAIRDLARRVDGRSAAVIFPEGTFFSAERKARAVERLAAGSRPELAVRAEHLTHLLPPRPAGTLALLDGAPTADVLVLGHIGFEQFSSLRAIRRAVPFRAPVHVWMWRVPRVDVPVAESARIDWLYDQWAVLDASITARLAASSHPSAAL
jgi:1-acyl-sn-glycerol-3-phosphate acyltransferase